MLLLVSFTIWRSPCCVGPFGLPSGKPGTSAAVANLTQDRRSSATELPAAFASVPRLRLMQTAYILRCRLDKSLRNSRVRTWLVQHFSDLPDECQGTERLRHERNIAGLLGSQFCFFGIG